MPSAQSHRQLNNKFGPFGNVILDADDPVMIGNNGTDNGESQTHPGLFCRKIRLEQARFIHIGNTRHTIRRFQPNPL